MSDVTSSNENNPLEISFKADLKEAPDSEPDLLRRVPLLIPEKIMWSQLLQDYNILYYLIYLC